MPSNTNNGLNSRRETDVHPQNVNIDCRLDKFFEPFVVVDATRIEQRKIGYGRKQLTSMKNFVFRIAREGQSVTRITFQEGIRNDQVYSARRKSHLCAQVDDSESRYDDACLTRCQVVQQNVGYSNELTGRRCPAIQSAQEVIAVVPRGSDGPSISSFLLRRRSLVGFQIGAIKPKSFQFSLLPARRRKKKHKSHRKRIKRRSVGTCLFALVNPADLPVIDQA